MRKAFKQRLARAKRRFSATEVLGLGILSLMPTDVISNSWVERHISLDQWNIWLQLVKKVNQDAYTVG